MFFGYKLNSYIVYQLKISGHFSVVKLKEAKHSVWDHRIQRMKVTSILLKGNLGVLI
jgi:hypothetical protein